MAANSPGRVLLSAILLALYLLYGGIALAYEEPGYQVVRTFPEFEVRQYEPYVVAETAVSGDFDDVGSKAFRRLFAYISEDDRPQGKIAMTTPVIQQPESLVVQPGTESDQDQGRLASYRFAFVMPANYTLESLPLPKDAVVSLREVPARLMAVRKYSGTWSEARYRKNEAILSAALKQQGLHVVGEPIFARYNAPFSLWFLRRNEVLMEIRPESFKSSAGDT